MFCNKCGKEINKADKFCGNCGNEISNLEVIENNRVAEEDKNDEAVNGSKESITKSNNKKGIIIGLGLAILAVLILLCFNKMMPDGGLYSNNNNTINNDSGAATDSVLKTSKIDKVDENGTRYIGDLDETLDAFHGKILFKSGDRFEGDYLEYAKKLNFGDAFDGTFFEKNGEKFVGKMLYDMSFDKGILYYKNGKVKYDGGWYDDKYNGFGSLYYENGKIHYKGNWLNGNADGNGTLYDKNGDIAAQGTFKNGEYVDESGN